MAPSSTTSPAVTATRPPESVPLTCLSLPVPVSKLRSPPVTKPLSARSPWVVRLIVAPLSELSPVISPIRLARSRLMAPDAPA